MYGWEKFAEVAPFAGAWIEMRQRTFWKSFRAVAPFAGAWIEMIDTTLPAVTAKSLPSRERGLKWYEAHRIGEGKGRSLRGSVD